MSRESESGSSDTEERSKGGVNAEVVNKEVINKEAVNGDSPRTNVVLVSLLLATLVAWSGLDAVSVAPNRIVPGQGHAAWDVAGWPGFLLSLVPMLAALALAWGPDRRRLRWALGLAVAMLAALPAWLALASARLVDADLPQARMGVGAGVWVALFLLLLALIELRTRLALPRTLGWSLLLVPLASLAAWLTFGLAPLALRQEFLARRDGFIAAIVEHLLLVGAAVGVSLVLGVLLALAMRRWARCRTLGFAVLNFLQTIPSLALFGLLLAPLAWLGAHVEWLAALGVSGIGAAPALLALVGYSLLPMVRNTFVALDEVDPGVIDAARGMGMSRGQVFRQVRLPLAAPVILEGIRITTVQAIGLTAVAALIGAGGLGTFIFQGLGQAAMDMVLLGALPILVMALIADALLGALTDLTRQGEAT
ncbi:Putative osmoprotectant uptake system permease protein YehY [Halomonas sp. THAF12]|uniref:ABC transporter permease n=1 Tax=Halomonas sp. THAF12 TaxID=2587849 RepID=UPI0012AA7D0B|nr:ABC transporter permease [Halomonas sp. THAF12]QFT85167.1 Putative osmoprotectant uptake system permease protein YehY [Halomonas sp. THAF12]